LTETKVKGVMTGKLVDRMRHYAEKVMTESADPVAVAAAVEGLSGVYVARPGRNCSPRHVMLWK
jgi:hypothetical protein